MCINNLQKKEYILKYNIQLKNLQNDRQEKTYNVQCTIDGDDGWLMVK